MHSLATVQSRYATCKDMRVSLVVFFLLYLHITFGSNITHNTSTQKHCLLMERNGGSDLLSNYGESFVFSSCRTLSDSPSCPSPVLNYPSKQSTPMCDLICAAGPRLGVVFQELSLGSVL